MRFDCVSAPPPLMNAGKDGVAETRVLQWAHELGARRHAHDEYAMRIATSLQQDARRRSAEAAERWPPIVEAIRRLADAYNVGARRLVLNVVEQSEQQRVTVATGGEELPSLTAALEDTLIYVDARDAEGIPHTREVRLRPDRSDDATAAYLLQDWLQHL